MRASVSLLAAGFGFVLCHASAAQAQHGSGNHGMCDPSTAHAEPILSAPDFDGDGAVDKDDVKLVAKQVGKGEYVAFFDANADFELNGKDVSAVAKRMGDPSSSLDQQLAEVFWATEHYRDQSNAIADGFRPYTQTLEGHGMHWARLPVLVTPQGGLDPNYVNEQDSNLDIAVPEGLNYDENGNLIAVYYQHTIDVRALVIAFLSGDIPTTEVLQGQAIQLGLFSAMSGGAWPYLFDSSEARWHQHWGACIDELEYATMTFDPTHVPYFTENVLLPECFARPHDLQQGYIAAFNMLHVWLYKLNPCGVFAGEHPDVAPGFPPEPDIMYRDADEWFDLMGLTHYYPY